VQHRIKNVGFRDYRKFWTNWFLSPIGKRREQFILATDSAQTILSLSFFACDKAADHTFRFARDPSIGVDCNRLTVVEVSLLMFR
jgi:hypothetical protein